MNWGNSSAPEMEICQILTCLPEKFIVDFANGIDVVRDHTRIQRSRTGFFQRFYDELSNQGMRRQQEINAGLTDGVEASLQWLTELSTSLAKTNFALAQVNTQVAMIQGSLTKVINYSADTRQQMMRLAKDLDARCSEIESEMSRIDLVQRANDHMDLVFSRWTAGKFSSFSISGRCYAALEELRWGSFGDFFRKSNKRERVGHLERLMNRSMTQMAEDAQLKPGARSNTRDWLGEPKTRDLIPNAMEALEYLGDWAQPNSQPFVHSTTAALCDLPLPMPRICSAERFSQALVEEVFSLEIM